MKNLGKQRFLPPFAAGTGVLALILRMILYAVAVDGKGLLVACHPAELALAALSGVVLAFLGAMVWKLDGSAEYADNFGPSKAAFWGHLAAAAGFLLTVLTRAPRMGGWAGNTWRLLGCLSPACLVLAGKKRERGEKPFFGLHLVPSLFLVLHIINHYQMWCGNPQLQDYIFTVFGSISLMFFGFYTACFAVGAGNRRLQLFMGLSAVYLLLAELATTQDLPLYLGGILWAVSDLCALEPKPVAQEETKAMVLPDSVNTCMEILENAGFSAYAVGGCVRDTCLGLTPQDYDLCTNALPQQMEILFAGAFQRENPLLVGAKHGTVGVKTPDGVVEITTYRQEGTYGDNRHPDWVDFVDNVEADLARRDFTVNAMAWSPSRGFADPFQGQQDLQDKVLRAVGDPVERFREDSLRILRGVRFAVRYGLRVEEKTMAAMVSEAPLMENLARERVFEELCKLLPLVDVQQMQTFAPILEAVIPELAPLMGFDQRSPHHAYDLYTHVAHVVAGVPEDLTLRWAALLHDVGKIATFTQDETGRGHFYGHAAKGAEMADAILRRLKAPTALREQVVLLIGKHMHYLVPDYQMPDKKLLRRQVSRLGWDTVEQLLILQEADMGSKGTGEPEERAVFSEIRQVLEEIRQEDACLSLKDLAVKGDDLMTLGLTGRAIGEALQVLLDGVLEERVANEREALLEYLKRL